VCTYWKVQLLTVEFAVALCRGLRCGKLTVAYACLWSVTDIFQLKIGYPKVRSCCECERLQLFPLVFCMGRAVHKFDFRLVTNETPNKWRSLFV